MHARRRGERDGQPEHGEARTDGVGAQLMAENGGRGEADDERVRPCLPGVRRGARREWDERAHQAVRRVRASCDDDEEARARERNPMIDGTRSASSPSPKSASDARVTT